MGLGRAVPHRGQDLYAMRHEKNRNEAPAAFRGSRSATRGAQARARGGEGLVMGG